MKRVWNRRRVFPEKLVSNRKFFDDKGVSPVIAVILLVAITVVLVSVLYVVVSNLISQQEITPKGALLFREDKNIDGKFSGEFQGSVALDRIEFSIIDFSENTTLFFDPSIETTKEIPGGLNITYDDVNENNKLDATDTLVIQNGEHGDRITIIYKRTGEAVAMDILG